MSHDPAERYRGVLYTVPGLFTDALRSLEFDDFFREYSGACFTVRTLDGWSWSSSQFRAPQFNAIFRTRKALDTVLEHGSEMALGRLFLNGDVELNGNMLVLLAVAQFTLAHADGLERGLIQTIGKLTNHFSRKLLPTRPSISESWHFAPCPLDVPAPFFQSWLGASLGHSCCWFSNPNDEFETAQNRALDRACESLELSWNHRLLDVGCGWGSLMLRASTTRGAHVHGVVSSEMQWQAATESIHRCSLQRRCSVEIRNLRKAPYVNREFDKIAHLGIFEQPSTSDLKEYLLSLRAMLVPGGMLLLHRLSSAPGSATYLTSLPDDFLSEGISPELNIAEQAGFDLVRVEDSTQEYEQTLRVWIENLLNADQHTRLFSNAYRSWMLYLIEIATCLNSREAQAHRLVLRRRK